MSVAASSYFSRTLRVQCEDPNDKNICDGHKRGYHGAIWATLTIQEDNGKPIYRKINAKIKKGISVAY